MRWAQIRMEDVANGPGIRVSIYVQGCSRHCKDCFNSSTWDFNGGRLFDQAIQNQFLDLGSPKKIVGFSILGGEPLQQGKDMLSLVKLIKERYPNKTIWMWTGYKYEELDDEQLEIISYIDVLVDGEFISDQKALNKRFKGSNNQRIIDVQETIKTGKITLNTFN